MGSVVVGDQGSLGGSGGDPVVPDGGGHGEQPLGDRSESLAEGRLENVTASGRHGSVRRRLSGFDEETHARCNEWSFRFYAVVKRAKPVPIGFHGEFRDDPDHLPQEMNNGRYRKLDAAPEFTQVCHGEPSRFGIDH